MKEIRDKLNFTELKTGSLGKTMSRGREDKPQEKKTQLIRGLSNISKEILKLNEEKKTQPDQK